MSMRRQVTDQQTINDSNYIFRLSSMTRILLQLLQPSISFLCAHTRAIGFLTLQIESIDIAKAA